MHSYPMCDWNQRSQIFKEDKNLRSSGHYGLFFLPWPKYYYQFSILTPPNCSVYLGRGTKFYALTKLLNYCNSSQIVSPEKFPQNLRIPSLMPKFNSTSPWMRNMKLLYLRWIAMQLGKLVWRNAQFGTEFITRYRTQNFVKSLQFICSQSI